MLVSFLVGKFGMRLASFIPCQAAGVLDHKEPRGEFPRRFRLTIDEGKTCAMWFVAIHQEFQGFLKWEGFRGSSSSESFGVGKLPLHKPN